MADKHISAIEWGLLGPETLGSQRRTRTLGLGAAVRSFNDLAVPGLGNIFYGKQLILALLGIRVAEQLREAGLTARNIETANAVEALACWLALDSSDWRRDPRVRGATKMRGKQDLSFASVKRRSFYVTQPMRMATGEPLLALGFVEASTERFNSFACANGGLDLIDSICKAHGPTYYKRNVLEHLVGWAKGEIHTVEQLHDALSPLKPLPLETRWMLGGHLTAGNDARSARRRAMLAWVARLAKTHPPQTRWTSRPSELDDTHWRDLHAGALFFAVREAALALLDQLEAHVRTQQNERVRLGDGVNTLVRPALKTLGERAGAFLEHDHDPSPDGQAGTFCRECLDEAHAVEHLVRRDDRVLRLRDGEVVPGPAFPRTTEAAAESDAAPEGDESELNATQSAGLPEGISPRARNLYLLHLDLEGSLNDWLGVPS
jgi:hypothetical protein